VNTRHAYADSSLGRLLLVAEAHALTGLYFENHRYPPAQDNLGNLRDLEDDRLLADAAQEVNEYLGGTRRAFTVPTLARGDDFSKQVWHLLTDIPYGVTTTYGELAQQLGNRHLAQRVGQSVGHNPLCILIPCHRVLGAGGALTGYAGGLTRKRALLALEEPTAKLSDRLF
jgi:methylated-DNA-[protein]-cysteine S-methyltransferase